MRPSIVPFLLTLTFLPLVGGGQTQEAAKKEEKRTLRFLPCGDMPPFRQEIRDGVRYELEAEPGSVPPYQIQVPLGEDKMLNTTLTLGSLSERLKLPTGPLRLPILQKSGELWKPWHEVTLPEKGDVMVFLWRDPKLKTWESARSMMLGDGLDVFPSGSLRLVNLLPTLTRFVFPGKTIELHSGESKIEIPALATLPVQISLQDASGNWQIIYQSAITQNPGERGQVILYRADGIDPRSPVKVLPLRERAPDPPPVKK